LGDCLQGSEGAACREHANTFNNVLLHIDVHAYFGRRCEPSSQRVATLIDRGEPKAIPCADFRLERY
jgi:hypothetical protein